MALLRRRDLSVTEVCFAVGCSSPGTFSTRFTELVGMPPSAYRNQARPRSGDAVVRDGRGTYAILTLATQDLDVTFARLEASDADIVQEPIEQPYGIRDCAVRDPAGNLLRINEVQNRNSDS